jgi:tetratricopeptide (TPR) repeat protein
MLDDGNPAGRSEDHSSPTIFLGLVFEGNILKKKRLLVVGWDSADWKIIRPLIAAGQMPMMARILQQGVHGNLTTLEPSLSPMLWTTIATGRHAAEHGVHGFTEVRDNHVVPVSASTRRCRAVWNILSDRGLKTNLVGWFASQGERDPNVRLVSNLYTHAPRKPVASPADWPAPPPGTFWPESLAEKLSPLRVGPQDLEGDVMRMFVKDPDKIDQEKDRRLFILAEKLAEAFSVQAAATWLMENEAWDLTMVYFRAIDEICHLFMPFHPPRMEGAPEKDFEHYHDVVNSAYRLHDLMLTRLVDLSGPEAGVMVISDHGFHSDHLRPRFTPRIPAGIVVWHRAQGIVAAAGQGFRRGGSEEIYGARLPDITPTILAWFGLPRAGDMEGRVLADALTETSLPSDIPTYEKPEDQDAQPTAYPFDDGERKAMLQHFVDLGYIDAVPDEAGKAAEQTQRENKWQLACALMHSGRFEEALPLLETCHDAMPQRPDFAQRLAHCQIQLGLMVEAEETIDASLQGFKDANAIALIRANIAYQRGNHARALSHLEEVEKRDPSYVGLREQLARNLLKLRRWARAEAMAREILERDPGYAPAWAIVARCQLHHGDHEGCVESSLEAIGLEFNSPLAHMNLGLALAGQGKFEDAVLAFRNVMKLTPNHIPAYRLLAQALNRMGREEEAEDWMNRARDMRQRANDEERERKQRVREGVKARARERAEHPPRPAPEPVKALELLLVSGLPRSGTSLMMQILQAGGIPLLTDGKRVADEDNPEGYWEWEDIKQLPKNPAILKQAEGRAVKLITALLPSLPRVHLYKVIYMKRPVEQVVASQFAMLRRKGIEPKRDAAQLAATQEQMSERVLEFMRKSDRIELLEIDYPDLIAHPDETIATINPALHRHRSLRAGT